MTANLYEELGVDKEVTPESLKDAFRRRAQATHPDKGGEPGEFERVKEAYEVLSDLGRRRTYDETGQTKAAPSLEEEAEGLLANLFQQYLDSDETEEPLSSMRRVMNQGKTAVTDQAKAAEKSLARVAKLVGKLTRKGEGQPTLVRVLDLKVAALEAQKADLGRQLKVIHAVFKSLDQWECKGFEREPVAKRRPESVQALMDPFLNQGNPYGHR